MNPETQGHPEDVFTPGIELECPPPNQNITIITAMQSETALLLQAEQENNAIR